MPSMPKGLAVAFTAHQSSQNNPSALESSKIRARLTPRHYGNAGFAVMQGRDFLLLHTMFYSKLN